MLPNQINAVALLLEGSNHDKVKEINVRSHFEKRRSSLPWWINSYKEKFFSFRFIDL